MKRAVFYLFVPALLVWGGSSLAKDEAAPKWNMNATIIEACSCPMFCQCYFAPEPSSHHNHASGEMEHFCKFNNAYRVNKGSYGSVKLDGAKFWVGGDLGAEFGDGTASWAVLTFDPSVTPEQREGIAAVLGHLYPLKWESFNVGPDQPMTWTADKDRAEAKLNDGKTAVVALTRFAGMTEEPIVIKNLKYWGAPRNTGFVLMPNTIQAWREGEKAFEFQGTNGFMITFDISSKDVS